MASVLSQDQLVALFEATPVALLVFDADLVMIHANGAYLRATDKSLSEIAGRYVFDVFPNSPMRDDLDQVTSLEAVMRLAVRTRETQTVTAYRYDIPLSDGTFEIRYWNASEIPVVDQRGRVSMVLHYTEDVTELVGEREAREAAGRVNAELQERVTAAQLDLRRRADELEVLNERLRRASEHDRSVAETLQQALLTTLPDVEPLRLHAHYRAAAASDRVGGDWYDAIRLRDGGAAVMIGDVVGHDIGAAALMGQLRSMLRAFVWASDLPPATVMAQLDRAMRDLALRTYASAVLATFTQPAGEAESGAYVMRWTNAGHPAPVLVAPDGSTSLLAAPSPTVLLGVRPDTVRPDLEMTLVPGSSVVFYTDGLVEARGEDVHGRMELLQRMLQEHRDLDPATRIERVIDDMVGPQSDDDVAVLVVELRPRTDQDTEARALATSMRAPTGNP